MKHPLGSELLQLLEHLCSRDGRQVEAFGDGIIALIDVRPHHDAKIPCTVVFDPQKWTWGSGDDNENTVITFTVESTWNQDHIKDTDSLAGLLRAMLKPRSKAVKFYDEPLHVSLKKIEGFASKDFSS